MYANLNCSSDFSFLGVWWLYDSVLCSEEDITDSKAHTYPRRRSHTIGSSNSEFNDGKYQLPLCSYASYEY